MEVARESSSGSDSVVGRFDDRAAAERAIQRLRDAGFSMEDLGFLGHHEAEPASDRPDAEGALQGAASGSLAGGVVGGIIGAVATALIPGVGPVVSAGILTGIVAGAPAGAIVGGIAGALKDAGVHEDDADRYEREFHDGRTLVTCRANGRESEAAEIIRNSGGEVESPIARAVTDATGTQPPTVGRRPASGPKDFGPRHEGTRARIEGSENQDGYNSSESAADAGPSGFTGGEGEPRPGTLGTPGKERY